MAYTIGIDPGLSGAITIMHGNKVFIFDTPILIVKNGKKTRREYNVAGMAKLLGNPIREIIYPTRYHVGLEKVHSMPGQGVRSMFCLGEGLGIWKGLVGMADYPLTLITPQAWKKEMLAGMGKEKDASRLRALQLFPELADQLGAKKDHGRADSLLIAEYVRRKANK